MNGYNIDTYLYLSDSDANCQVVRDPCQNKDPQAPHQGCPQACVYYFTLPIRARFLLLLRCIPVQECYDLLSCAGLLRTERRVARTIGNAVLYAPRY